MASRRISFRARKIVTHDAQQRRVAPQTSSDGVSQGHKKRKLQQAEKQIGAEEIINSTMLVSGASSSTTETLITTTTEKGEDGQFVKQVMVSVTNLSKTEAIAVAIQHLKCCDAKLREVIEVCQLPSFQSCSNPFRSLASSIVYQQLAGSAAKAIYNRLLLLCGGEGSLTPAVISKLSATELRNIGISARKASYLHDLSRNFLEGGLSDASIMLMEDEELLSALTSVKGIGVWSVHMFMIFSLHRPDVLPVGDLGVRKGFLKLYNLKSLPSPSEMERISAPWRPYRSLGAWYMWRLIERKSPVVSAKEKV
ncbi:hypothetical protein GOP47_0018794 [Adiantum capillus-veneris]|uniref:HhH-GPD domain-containing protein n=1 Tax=Adiantum capillus-veneris TaxID=13818 RepID=A0A9D4UE24_ADICA|nr:hypothetical protein GOP47_0018794 [Adiantum capillus-veneris]